MMLKQRNRARNMGPSWVDLTNGNLARGERRRTRRAEDRSWRREAGLA